MVGGRMRVRVMVRYKYKAPRQIGGFWWSCLQIKALMARYILAFFCTCCDIPAAMGTRPFIISGALDCTHRRRSVMTSS